MLVPFIHAQIYDENIGGGDDAYGDDAYAAGGDGDDAYGDDTYGDDAAYAAGDDDAYNDDAYNNDDEGEGENQLYNQYEDSDPLDILAYSEACNIELFGSACPDPYGIKQGYDNTLKRALKNKPSMNGGLGKQAMQIASFGLFAVGAVLFAAAYIIRKRSADRIINDKDATLLSPEPMEKPRSLIHTVSSKARKLKEKFQDFAEEEVDDSDESISSTMFNVVDSPSKDDSYIQLNNDSPTEEDEPAPIPSPEKPVLATVDPIPVSAEPSAQSGLEPAAPSPVRTSSGVSAASPVASAASSFVASPVATEASTTPTKKKMKKKRPLLNKISKTLFGKKNRSVVKTSSSASI